MSGSGELAYARRAVATAWVFGRVVY
jgi:hypothetical protein